METQKSAAFSTYIIPKHNDFTHDNLVCLLKFAHIYGENDTSSIIE